MEDLLTFHHLGLAVPDVQREARLCTAVGYAPEGGVR